jgi:magnesium transporter
MLETTVFASGVPTVVADPADIAGLVGRPDHLVWMDVEDATDEDLEWIEREFGLHPLAMEDVRKKGQRPKLELYQDHVFIVGYAHDPDADLPEVELFVGPNWLVSLRSRNTAGRQFEVGTARRRYEQTRTEDASVGFLLYTLLDEMVDGYFDTTDQIEDRLEEIESRLFEGGVAVNVKSSGVAAFDAQIQGELLQLRRTLITTRRRIVPMREVLLAILRREVEWIHGPSILYFQDVLDHLLRITDEIDTQRELLGNVVDAHLALVANRTNDVMKKTSSWGAILIVSTLIAGIYGMNFRNMPELGWEHGYFIALGSMVVAMGVLYAYFKRKGWL